MLYKKLKIKMEKALKISFTFFTLLLINSGCVQILGFDDKRLINSYLKP